MGWCPQKAVAKRIKDSNVRLPTAPLLSVCSLPLLSVCSLALLWETMRTRAKQADGGGGACTGTHWHPGVRGEAQQGRCGQNGRCHGPEQAGGVGEEKDREGRGCGGGEDGGRERGDGLPYPTLP